MEFREANTCNNLHQGNSVLKYFLFSLLAFRKGGKNCVTATYSRNYLEISKLRQAALSSGHKHASEVLT